MFWEPVLLSYAYQIKRCKTLFLHIISITDSSPSASHQYPSTQKLRTYAKMLIFLYFFDLFGRSPSLPREFTVFSTTLPVLRVFHCERCRRIWTRDHCLSSLERYQWATTSPQVYFSIWKRGPEWLESRKKMSQNLVTLSL